MAAQSQGLFLCTIAHERPRRRARQIRQLDCSPRERRQRQAPRLPIRALQLSLRVAAITQPIIDIHVHIMPFHMMKPDALALIKHGRKDYADVERYCSDPKAFLALLDQLGIERAGLINYVAPDIIGFTPEVNDWSANNLPVMIHTGTSIFPGARNLHAQPMLCDDVCIDYPNLVVILAHGGRPLWMNEAFFLVRRHKNMYMDVSGIPPQKLLEYFPRIEDIADKVLWGTDWPGPGVPEIKGNIEKFNALPIAAEAKRKILYDNAARLFPN